MRLWGVLVGALLALGCAKSGALVEGPPALVVRAPRAAEVEDLWVATLFMQGREVIGPACVLVDAQNAPLLGSCFDLYTRMIRVEMRFPRSLYLEMAYKNPMGQPQPGDTLEPVPPGPLTEPLFDEWDWNGDVIVRFTLYRAEPDNVGVLRPGARIATKTIPVRLSCMDCMV